MYFFGGFHIFKKPALNLSGLLLFVFRMVLYRCLAVAARPKAGRVPLVADIAERVPVAPMLVAVAERVPLVAAKRAAPVPGVALVGLVHPIAVVPLVAVAAAKLVAERVPLVALA